MFLAISFLEFIKNKIFSDNNEDKIAKYWENHSKIELIEIADNLFVEEKFVDVYETLNRIKYSKDIEVIWRLARVLYNLSLSPEINNEVRKEMIHEAQTILERQGKCNFHKWMAIILNQKNGLESLETKIREYPVIRDHLIEACKSNPRDFTVRYMLGRWYYEMANLSWFQRKIAKYLYLEPPTSTYLDAYKHLNKAEELEPRKYIPNIYILGNVCLKLGQYYRAKYYFNMALNLPIHTACEKCYVAGAQHLLAKLEKYDLGKDVLYEHYYFGFEN